MNEITMIPVGLLEHHPENPRRDLGDLSELTESIRKNGIMQNLTVVADMETNKYLVVIGNRRLEAAKAAGLIQLPCVVRDLDHKTQIATMLMENMQRQDLTVYEQAQGFQMMMDLGFSAGEIADKTGFGETTVRRRIKMAEMDADLLKKACEEKGTDRQITLMDFERLAQVESIEERNDLLKVIGERDFTWNLNRTLRRQAAQKVIPEIKKTLEEAGVKELPENKRFTYGEYNKLYNETVKLYEWKPGDKLIPESKRPLFYVMDEYDVEFYEKAEQKKEQPKKKTEAEKEEERKIEQAWKIVERCAEAATESRRRFAEGLTVSPKNAMRMMQWALIAAFGTMLQYSTPVTALVKRFDMQQMNIPERVEKLSKILLEMPQKQWPNLILLMFEGDREPKTLSFTCGSRLLWPKFDRKVNLELCYEWLTEFGYQMSTEEAEMMAGTHECLKGGKE